MKRTTFITRTALMIALALVAQSLRYVIPTAPTLVIGSFVNLVIIISAGIVGAAGATIVSLITPIYALIQGGPSGLLATSWIFTPCIMAGNLALALIFAAFYKKNRVLGGALGSIAKFGVLYGLMVLWAIPAFAPAKLVAPLSAAFGISQLVTAAIGTALGLVVLLLLNRAGISKEKNTAR